MNLTILPLILMLAAVLPMPTSAQSKRDSDSYFEGHIHYVMNYTDLKGQNINDKVAAFFDREQKVFVNATNYMVMNERGQHVKLYQADNNAYFFFNRDNTAYKIDQTAKTTRWVRVFDVDDVDTILGYPCKAIKVDADFRAYIYFYNPEIKVDVTPYLNYNMEEWNAYLKASGGALPLRVITIDVRSKFIEDKRAISINPSKLSNAHFAFPKSVKLKRPKYGVDLVW
ncbi:MAG TPA: hypothetical protein VKZ76_05860 [Edaphocola sp.]|nr:hypothetical protein [Edaphocola sp.]